MAAASNAAVLVGVSGCGLIVTATPSKTIHVPNVGLFFHSTACFVVKYSGSPGPLSFHCVLAACDDHSDEYFTSSVR